MIELTAPAIARHIRATAIPLLFLAATMPAGAAVITVTSDSDSPASGACTLREAIESANLNVAVGGCSAGDSGLDTVAFDLPPNPFQINIPLTAPLLVNPGGEDPLIIDGESQVGASCPDNVRIALSGFVDNLLVLGGGSTVRGLAFNNFVSNFTDSAIRIEGPDNRVECNSFSGSAIAVEIVSGPGNVVGTNGDGQSDLEEGNVFVALFNLPGGTAVRIGGAEEGGFGPEGNRVSGNFIGMARGATTVSDPLDVGVDMEFAGTNLVGTDSDGRGDIAERNYIGATVTAGVITSGNGQVIAGNHIGTGPTGDEQLGNDVGIMFGGEMPIERGGIESATLVRDNYLTYNDTAIQFPVLDQEGGPLDLLTFEYGSEGNCVVGNTVGVTRGGALPEGNGGAPFYENWWGDESGPSGDGPGSGDSVIGDVEFAPWLVGPAVACAPLVLEKSFLDDPVAAGASVTLEFTITNVNAGETVEDLQFDDDLDAVLTGLEAIGLPQFDVCGPGSVLDGTSVLSLAGGRLTQGASCGFSVTLQVPPDAVAGTYLNVTTPVEGHLPLPPGEGELETVVGTSATDVLVVGLPGLEKSFTDDPTLPGDSVTLEFTITNPNPGQGFGGIDFNDDLEDLLPGLTALGLPMDDVCGMGSQLSGTSFVSLTGGNLAAASSCTFSVTLDVPESAPAGDYLNTTSPLFIGSEETETPPATDTLKILGLPVFSKSFVNDPVAPGTTVTLAFSITNTDPIRRAGEISFTDSLDSVVPGLFAPDLVASPILDACGAGSVLSGPSVLTLTGGNLDPLATCVFEVSLLVPTVGPGTYPNATSELTADIGGGGGRPGTPVTVDPATDNLVVAYIPILTKAFTDDPVLPGDPVTLEFTIFNSNPSLPATDIGFVDDLNILTSGSGTVLTPLEAIMLPANGFCGAGSSLTGTSVLTMVGGILPAGGSCTFTTILQVPSTIMVQPPNPNEPPFEAPLTDGSYLNTTSVITATINGGASEGHPATDALMVLSVPRLSKVFVGPPADPGAQVDLQFTINNVSSSSPAEGMTFTDDLASVLPGLVAIGLPLSDVCGAGSRLVADGGDPSQLQLLAGVLPPEGNCTFSVPVQVPPAAVPGVYPNVTSDLTATLAGVDVTGLPATADLLIASDSVAFSKEFNDDPVLAGQAATQPVTLEFTISNSHPTDQLTDLTFDDDLDDVLPGMVHTGLPLSDACGVGSSLFAIGASAMRLTGGNLGLGETCTFSVMTQVPSGAPAGSFRNITTPLYGNSAGAPTEGLDVLAPPAIDFLTVLEPLVFLKSFTDDPALPGGSATLEFTITNNNVADPVTMLTFTDDLEAVLPGLEAVGLPLSDVCGPGSVLSGTSFLTLTDGIVGPASSCVFSVTLNVPVGAPEGNHRNTTSPIEGQLDELPPTEGAGIMITGDPAIDSLTVAGIPVLAKLFLENPVAPGGSTTLQFTITNNNAAEPATALTFTDDLDTVLAGLVATGLPMTDVCGPGSEITGTTVLQLTGGTLAASRSCTFSVALDVPPDVLPGIYPNVTSPLAGEVGGVPIQGNAAATNLQIAAIPLLGKLFLDDPVPAGATVDLEFTITNTSTDQNATDLQFTDDLDSMLPGAEAVGLPVSDVCGLGSEISGTSILTFTGGNLAPDTSCAFVVTLQLPAEVEAGTYTNVTSTLSGLVGSEEVEGAPATDDLDVLGAPLFVKTFIDDPVAAGDTVVLEFTIAMQDLVDPATDIGFTDDLDAVTPGLVALGLPISDLCGPGSELTGTSLIELTGGNLEPGASCTFGITLQVPGDAPSGLHPNVTSDLTATLGGFPVVGPPAADDLAVSGALSAEKAFTDDPVVAGGLVTLEFSLANSDQTFPVTDIAFTDNLEATLTGLVAVGLPLPDVCGAGSTIAGTDLLTFTGGTLPPGGSCTFAVTLAVPAGALPTEYPNRTSDVTGTLDGEGLTAPPAQDTLVVSEGLVFAKSFTDDPASPGGAVTLEFTIDYLGLGGDATSISFTDDLDATLAGLTATSLPADGFCGAGSQLTGTSLLEMTGGTLAPGGSCTFQATLQLPVTTLPGGYTNTTSELMALVPDEGSPPGVVISAPPATDRLEVVAGLGFEKRTNGVDADLPPGPTILVGGPVGWEYALTNETGAPLTDIVVSDSEGVAVSCPSDTLAPGETMVCTGAGTAVEGQYANVGSVTGLSANRLITTTDLSHYFGLPVDFGDAPPDFPTLLGADGARHVRVPGVHLGPAIDLEPDGLPTPGADGDDTTGIDDEDGIAFVSPVIAGTAVDLEVEASVAGLLNAWIDFNDDGDWMDAGEQVFTDEPLAAGLNSLVVPLPSDAEPVATFSRWRFSTAGGDGVVGLAADGEVEDHAVQIFAEADLTLAKSDIWDPRMAGKPQTYVLSVVNEGPSMARNVSFEDTLPAETLFVSVEPAAPTCSGASGFITCDLGDLDAGEEAEVRFDVMVDPTFEGTIVNDANTGSSTVDPDPANNFATEDSSILALMDLVALPDVNGNGSSEIAVLEPGSLKFTVVDGNSGNVISTATLASDYVPIAMEEVPNFAGAGSPELAILALRPSDDAVTVFIFDSSTGAPVRTHAGNPDYGPMYLATVPDFGGSSAPELAILGRRHTDGMPRVFVLDADTGTQLKAFNFPLPYFPLAMEVVPDFTGGGVAEISVVGRRGSDRAVQVTTKDAATGATAAQWFNDHTFLPLGLGHVPTWDAGPDRMAILGRRSNDGAVRLFVRKVTNGVRDTLYGHPLAFLPMDLGVLMDFDGPSADETAVLRWRPADGDARTSVKDASDGSFLTGVRSDPAYYPLDLEIQPDWAVTLAEELAVLGVRTLDGDLKVFLFDAGNGVLLGELSIP